LKLNVEVRFFHSLTVSGLAKVAIYTTNVDAEKQTLINHKCVCGALNRQFLIGAVLNETFGSYLSKKQLPYQN
jgi:hypothetical protein